MDQKTNKNKTNNDNPDKNKPTADKRLFSLPPVCGTAPRVLILGSMPGAESLRLSQYYAHPQNRFWRILFQFFGAEYTADYAVRLQLVRDNGIALWDAYQSCLRPDSSLDAKISNGVPTDIPGFLRANPSVKTILTHGKESHRCFNRAYPTLQAACLPSASPANAAFSFERLYEVWSRVLSDALR